MHINYLAEPTPKSEYTATVISLDRTGSYRHINYECTVKTEYGTIIKLEIRSRDYYALSPNDPISVQYYDGALNIPFYTYEIP